MSGVPKIIHIQSEYSTIWKLSLLSFVVAALTGFLYRYGFLGPLPGQLHLDNIRHAHSHLMFFNWITPPIMVWMAASVVSTASRSAIRRIKICLYTLMALGFLSGPFFLLYGYNPVAIGSVRMPIAAMLSGLVMLTWYWFGSLYYKARQGIKSPSLSVVLFDGALIALVVSSLGAWGVSVYQFSSLESPLISKALTSFFLGVFTEGWVILGVLGILWNGVERQGVKNRQNWYWMPVLLGSMLVFPFSLDHSMLTAPMLWSAKAGLVLIGASLALHLYSLGKSSFTSTGIGWVVLLLLAVKILFQAGAVFPSGIWPGEHGLRILYLHLVLLGFGTTGVITSFNPNRGCITTWSYIIGMAAVLITLGMFSGYWPRALVPDNLAFWLAGAALLPVPPVVWLMVKKV